MSGRFPNFRYLKRQAAWRGECLRCRETPEWAPAHCFAPRGLHSQWRRCLWGDVSMMAKEKHQKAKQAANLLSIKVQKYACIPVGPFNSIILLLCYTGKCWMSIAFWSLKAGDLYDFWSKRDRFHPFCTMKTVKFFTSHGDMKILTIHTALSDPWVITKVNIQPNLKTHYSHFTCRRNSAEQWNLVMPQLQHLLSFQMKKLQIYHDWMSECWNLLAIFEYLLSSRMT